MIRHNVLFRALLGVGLLGMASYVSAADIKIDNQDVGTGQGLDDPTPASPVGGNPGTTRGEQARDSRLRAARLRRAIVEEGEPEDGSERRDADESPGDEPHDDRDDDVPDDVGRLHLLDGHGGSLRTVYEHPPDELWPRDVSRDGAARSHAEPVQSSPRRGREER